MSLDLLGAKPSYVDSLSPAAAAEYNKQVDAYCAKGMKPDDVDRAMASYGPSYFEGKARSGKRTTTTSVARAAGAAAVAAKSCGADGDARAWAFFLFVLIVALAIWALRFRRPTD